MIATNVLLEELDGMADEFAGELAQSPRALAIRNAAALIRKFFTPADLDRELAIAEAAAHIPSSSKTIVMTGTISSLSMEHFPECVIMRTNVNVDDGPNPRSWAKLELASDKLPRNCLGNKLRVTVELDDLDAEVDWID